MNWKKMRSKEKNNHYKKSLKYQKEVQALTKEIQKKNF